MKAGWWDAPLMLGDLAEGTRMILTMGGSLFCFHGGHPGRHAPVQATHTPIAIPVVLLPPPPPPGNKAKIYMNSCASN